jgi:hypothetical protein
MPAFKRAKLPLTPRPLTTAKNQTRLVFRDSHTLFTLASLASLVILLYTWYMGKRAPIYRAGKASALS